MYNKMYWTVTAKAVVWRIMESIDKLLSKLDEKKRVWPTILLI
jgi:hypothetical protein